MKAEIYSIVDRSFNPKSLDKKMNIVTNHLKEADIEILYKTDLEDDKIKLLEALRQSYATDEGIQLIIIANALDGTADCDTVKLFKKLCPKHNESEEGSASRKAPKKGAELDDVASEFESKKSKKKKQENDEKVVYEIWSAGDLGRGYEGCFMLYDDKLVLALPKESLTKVPTAEMIITGAKKATSARGITTGYLVGGKITDHFDYYAVAQENTPVKKKGSFISNFIPAKGDKPLEVVRKVVLMVATITFIVTAVILCKLLFIEPAQVEKNYDDLREIVHPVKVNSDTDVDPSEPTRFEKLQAINPEIVGWIYIPKTTYIDYPVLEHKGDGDYSQYYLHRDYKKNSSSYGSIFVDYRCTKSIQSKNVILHGHNMDNGQVFHQLLSYADINFYRSTPVIQFDTPDYDADWKIISVFKTNTLPEHGEFFNYLRGSFSSETDFMDFAYNIMERSLIDTGVTVNENDQLLTLSTCSYEFTNFRTVIVARRVRKGESSEVDVSKAKPNTDAVWPQCWYARNGGQRKQLTDFGTACRSGQTPWYDGDYKLDKQDLRKVKPKHDYSLDEVEEEEEEETDEEEREESERLEKEREESEREESERLEREKEESRQREESEKEEKKRRESELAESRRLQSERDESEAREYERLLSEMEERERQEREQQEQPSEDEQPSDTPQPSEDETTPSQDEQSAPDSSEWYSDGE